MIAAVPKPMDTPATRRKRGNPNWGTPPPPIARTATEFELQVRKLGLTKETCATSAQLRAWCEQNKNRCYIPELLLEEWGIAVNVYTFPKSQPGTAPPHKTRQYRKLVLECESKSKLLAHTFLTGKHK